MNAELAADPKWINWARKIARPHARKFPTLRDEIESASLMAVVEASRTFRADRGASFKTHVTKRIRGAIMDAKRMAAPAGYRARGCKIGVAVDHCPSSLLSLSITSDDLPIGWEAEYQDELVGMQRSVEGKAGAVIRMIYGEAGTTFRTAGAAIGVTEARAWQLHAAGIGKLRQRMGVGA